MKQQNVSSIQKVQLLCSSVESLSEHEYTKADKMIYSPEPKAWSLGSEN